MPLRWQICARYSSVDHFARSRGEHAFELQTLCAVRQGLGQIRNGFEVFAISGAKPRFAGKRARDRPAQGLRAAARLALQPFERDSRALVRFRRFIARGHEIRNPLVQFRLFRRRVDDHAGRHPMRQVNIHRGACVAHHHLREKPSQLLEIFGRSGPGSVHIGLLEIRFRRQQSWLEDRNEAIQLEKIVLDRSGGQHEDELLLERVHQFPIRAGPVLQTMRLVDDDHVPSRAGERAGVRLESRCGDRGDHHVLFAPKTGRIAAELGVVRRSGGEAEFFDQLAAPLRRERRRCQNQRPPDHPAHAVFLQHQTGFDGLAEPDFIRQQRTAFEVS